MAAREAAGVAFLGAGAALTNNSLIQGGNGGNGGNPGILGGRTVLWRQWQRRHGRHGRCFSGIRRSAHEYGDHPGRERRIVGNTGQCRARRRRRVRRQPHHHQQRIDRRRLRRRRRDAGQRDQLHRRRQQPDAAAGLEHLRQRRGVQRRRYLDARRIGQWRRAQCRAVPGFWGLQQNRHQHLDPDHGSVQSRPPPGSYRAAC